jgi:hypothetical protein
VDGFEYLWDMSSELVEQGIVQASAAVDDRVIAAHGLSRPASEARNNSRLRRRTLGPVSVVAASGTVALPPSGAVATSQAIQVPKGPVYDCTPIHYVSACARWQ